MEVGDGENTSRMRRQKAYLQAAISQIQLQSSEDAKFMAKAYQQIMEYATSDMNMNAITKLGPVSYTHLIEKQQDKNGTQTKLTALSKDGMLSEIRCV